MNEYIPLDSCHHKTWLCNIPWVQVVLLRRNCSSESEFMTQSQVLAERFYQKGYLKEDIEGDIQKVNFLDSTTLISDTQKVFTGNKHEYKLVLDYNIQQKTIEK